MQSTGISSPIANKIFVATKATLSTLIVDGKDSAFYALGSSEHYRDVSS